jgi:uncharacterized Fe-S cluster protein YjdI
VYGEWTLIARFSNGDSKHWIDNSAFWYDRVTPYGEVDNPLGNTDMISSSFWEKKGSEIRITRSDDPSNTALLQTTSNCLRGNASIFLQNNNNDINVVAAFQLESKMFTRPTCFCQKIGTLNWHDKSIVDFQFSEPQWKL